jgi:hypothetical protein
MLLIVPRNAAQSTASASSGVHLATQDLTRVRQVSKFSNESIENSVV